MSSLKTNLINLVNLQNHLSQQMEVQVLEKVQIVIVLHVVFKYYLTFLYKFWIHVCIALTPSIFRSPERKAQVIFSDLLSSFVRPPARPSICLSICSHFHLLLQNHWANFNQTWHKSSCVKGHSPFSRVDNYEIA